MKKIIGASLLSAVIIGVVAIFAFSAQAADVGGGTNGSGTEGVLKGCTITEEAALLDGCSVDCNFDTTPKCGICCLLQTLYKITDWIFIILVALASVFIIIGSLTLLMSAGDSQKVSSGRNYILYAAIGLIVGSLARVIPNIVRLISGA